MLDGLALPVVCLFVTSHPPQIRLNNPIYCLAVDAEYKLEKKRREGKPPHEETATDGEEERRLGKERRGTFPAACKS